MVSRATYRKGVAALLIALSAAGLRAQEDYTRYVNPFIGTGGHGHTFPGATTPFGMVQLSPDTRVEGWDACGGYFYADTAILGFSHTHLSGTGIADYGDIMVAPSIGRVEQAPRSMRFLHEHETASPGYYSVLLEEDNIKAELTATAHVGVHRYTFPKAPGANILIDLHHGLGPDSVLSSGVQFMNTWEVTGMRRSSGWAKDQRVYFVARFSLPAEDYGTIVNDTVRPHSRAAEGTNVRAYVRFSTSEGEQVVVKVALSGVSVDEARKNLLAEMPEWDFDAVRQLAHDAWNRELGRIEVEGRDDDHVTLFYTALYHAMIAPNLASDVDGSYRGMDGEDHTAGGEQRYTVFSLWDTFRAEHPLLSIIDRRRTLDFVNSLLAKGKESGTLPVWELAANETWTMIGYHAVPVIVDAWMKGIRGFDLDSAYGQMKKSAMSGRFGLQAYRTNGYIPGDAESESVSKTLEYAYDDWCIAQAAGALGKTEEERLFLKRSQSYKNLFDPATRLMRPRVNGTWVEPFDPSSVTVHYTEANPWQYSFFAPQDVDGLIRLFGGRRAFAGKLDSLFGTTSQLSGRAQADITGMVGQYAQGNEPSHHIAYLYDYAGQPWKTQRTVRRIMDSLYTNGPEGLCGNDDCGQMSAWYVMSALGLYQVCPGEPLYAIGSPLFDKAVLHLESGARFVIQAENNSADHRFIGSAKLNGSKYDSSYIRHDRLMQGGTLLLKMQEEPDTAWGSAEQDAPHSLPASPIVPVPFVRGGSKIFADSTVIELGCADPGASVAYSLSAGGAEGEWRPYRSPLTIGATSDLLAVASGSSQSDTLRAHFIRRRPEGRVRLNTAYSRQYTGGGDQALVDGERGGPDFRLGAWQGYHQNDLDAVVDLGASRQVTKVALGSLQDNNSWIFFPVEVEFSFSEEGATFGAPVKVVNDISPRVEGAMVKEFGAACNVRARYIRVFAKNIGLCPSWHKGAGEPAWLFADEIMVDAQ